MRQFRRVGSLSDLQNRAALLTESSDGVIVNRFTNSTAASDGVTVNRFTNSTASSDSVTVNHFTNSTTVKVFLAANQMVSHLTDWFTITYTFNGSYAEMERKFKVYVYKEGEPPMAHDGPCKEMYSIEGRFINELEHGTTRFRTSDPERAHIYFLPFSVTSMVEYLYRPLTYDLVPLKQVLWYLKPTLNSTADPSEASAMPTPPKVLTLKKIPHLAFFAGGVHGPIRPILLDNWKGRDNDMKVYEYLPEGVDYYSFMLQSKYCLCPSGYEVASPRVVESIYAECIPVILSKKFVLPLSDVLRWESFSVQVKVSDIPRLKEVLTSISEEKYMKLKENLRAVRKHFMLNKPAERFDAFHMILHSIWLRRLNMRLS
ncbi:hypothetical protein Patl1_12493 [Pistacia atlantica]|uniref:Uncharacterized protein n=1 Tax=Pistacia atlantica TaxID=434234 RepID=A0ACC1AVF3_9ROSI|nr:hypothetical protein Patl1_12493 [Pistacia atlantica]